MNRYSTQLLLAGAMLGTLVLSAAGLAQLGGTGKARKPAEPVLLTAHTTEATDPWAAPAAAAGAFPSDVGTGPFRVRLQLETERDPGRLFLCDKAGLPLDRVVPDRNGEAELGPIAPGLYSICVEDLCLGSFRLLPDAGLAEAEGRLWTEGALLHLTDKPTGEAVLELVLPCPGYYSLYLVDRWGQRIQQDLFIPREEPAGPAGVWRRKLTFRGLPEGLYTAVYAKNPLAQFRVATGSSAQALLTLERNTQ